MAENKLVPFANGASANVVDETTWQGNSLSAVRTTGFQSGIAKSAQVTLSVKITFATLSVLHGVVKHAIFAGVYR